MNTTAHAVAEELRKVADSLDREPEAEITTANLWWMYHSKDDKERFKRIVRLLPHPLTKRLDSPTASNPSIIVDYRSDALDIDVRIPRSATCRMVEPAKEAVYECEPILSDDEEADILSKDGVSA